MNRTKYLIAPVLILIASFGRFSAEAATLAKADNTDNLNQTTSWSGGVVPGSGDVALWDGTVTGANSVLLGADLSWQGLSLTSPGGAVTIGAGNTLTLGASGIDLSAATQNLTISSGLTLGSGNQVWNVASGRTLTLNTGTFTRSAGRTLNLQGSGTFAASMTGLANVNSIIGPWATVGSGTSSRYATLATGNLIAFTGGTAAAAFGWPSGNNNTFNYDVAGTQAALGVGRVANTARYTGAAGTQNWGNNNTTTITLNGLMNAGTGTLTFGEAGGTSQGQLGIGSNNGTELVLSAANAGITINIPIINAGSVAVTGPNTVTINSTGGASTYTGGTTVNSGTLALGAGGGAGSIRGTLTINNGATVQLNGTDALGFSAGTSVTQINVAGGALNNNVAGNNGYIASWTLTGGTMSSSGGGAFNIRGNGAGLSINSLASATQSTISGNVIIRDSGANLPINVADGTAATDLLISGIISQQEGTAGFTKNGTGTLTLSGVNTYAGDTTNSGGTLKLSGSGSIASSANIIVNSGTTFDVSSVSFTLAAGKTLKGSGTVTGNVTTASSTASIQPGTSAGTLTFNNNLNMSAGGSATFELSTDATTGNDKVIVSGDLSLSSSDTISIDALSDAANLDTTTDYVLFQVSGTTTMSTTPTLAWIGTTPANYLQYAVTTNGNNVVLRYSSATAPTVTAAADPASPTRNQPVVITATVTPGSGNIASVNVDASPIGGSPTTSLVLSNSFIYTNTVAVSASTTTGAKLLLVAVTDDTTPTPLSGSYNLALTVVAGGKTWDGGSLADDNWTSNPNWTSDIGPALSGDSVTFAGTTRLTPSLDANHNVTGVTFDATAGSFNVGTSSSVLTLASGTGIANNSASAQTLTVPITLGAAQTINAAAGDVTLASNVTNAGNLITVSGAFNTAISGAVTGGGGITKSGGGTLTLTGENNFTGSLFGKSGTVVIGTGGRANTGGSYCSIGVATGDNAVLTLSGTGTFTNSNDFNLGDLNDSIGTLNLQDNAIIQAARFFVGSANASGSTAQGTVNQTGGTLIQTDGGIGTFSVGGRTSTSGVGTYNLSGGTLTAAGGIRVGGTGTGTLNLSGTGALNAVGGINIARLAGSTGTANLNGGIATTLNITSSTGLNCTNNFNGGTVKPTTANTWISGLTRANVRDGGAILDTAGINVTVSQALVHSDITGDNATDGGLSKKGAGILTLTGTSTYTGATTISNGTLRVNGSIAGSGVTVVSGATLDGTGTIGGAVNVESGGTLAPGTSIGTMTHSVPPMLAGHILMEIAGPGSADKLVVLSGTVVFGGALTVTNIGPVLVNGNTFDLFDGALSGSFGGLNLPNGPAHWDLSDLNVGGTITYTNANPVAAGFALGVAVGGSVTAEVVGKYASATDADGDAVTITAVSTPANGTAVIVGGTNILYTSTNSAAGDSFTYTVSDGLGGTDTKTVTVATYNPEGFNRLSPPSVIGAGTVTLSYLGIPNEDYALDWTTNLTPPIVWSAVITNPAAGNGTLSFTNTSAEPVNFFRTRHVP